MSSSENVLSSVDFDKLFNAHAHCWADRSAKSWCIFLMFLFQSLWPRSETSLLYFSLYSLILCFFFSLHFFSFFLTWNAGIIIDNCVSVQAHSPSFSLCGCVCFYVRVCVCMCVFYFSMMECACVTRQTLQLKYFCFVFFLIWLNFKVNF